MLRRILKMPIANFPYPTSEIPSAKEILTPTTAVHAIRQASLPGGEPELVDVLDPNESFMFVMDSFLDYIAFMMNRRVQNCSFRFICESQH